jgi:large subunit ribosomal protein L31
MKAKIHPNYVEAHVRCMCGNEFTTRAAQEEIHVEVCSNCHPFYTGRQKLIDTGGRVERFQRRVAKGRQRNAGRSEVPPTSNRSSGTQAQARPQ